ncbi:hypothetical protein MPRF_39650 [Mycolicibacterium parafortuitum]|uniref:DUF7159 domain-containing protein n=1 Tax=Mycolicibacterium parafortuitum TaxID=39692 RepID=A0A7I7U9P9_MYCPF|nr:hypothetical protein [Mycolicibacterium parafortuitum]BBY77066.1 hypothetical protein MPRF_39650 [Mycolicibacterium parafortuitum]
MGVVLGLSLTSEDVAWVLVDEAGAVLDHDVIEVHADDQIAGAAARGAHAIATNAGVDVDRVRLTWSKDAAGDGPRLQNRLRGLGFEAEAVPYADAVAVMVRPDTEAGVALAYGAASAVTTTTTTVRATGRRRMTRARIAVAVLGAAAAAAAAGLLLTSGSVPAIEQTAADVTPAVEAGWVSVPVSSGGAAGVVRKVVPAQASSPQVTAEPVRRVYAVAPAAVPSAAPAAVPSAAPAAVPAAVPHLPEGVPHHMAAPAAPAVPVVTVPVETVPEAVTDTAATGQAHLPDAAATAGPGEVAPLLPDTDMTVPVNLFSALP